MIKNETSLETEVLFKVEIKEDIEAKQDQNLDLFLIEITEGQRTHYERGFKNEEEAKIWIRDAVTIK